MTDQVVTGPSRDIRPMSAGIAFLQDALVGIPPAIVLGIVGYLIGKLQFVNAPIGVSFFLVCAWILAYIGPGIRVIPQQCWVVYERFGRFKSVAFHGIRWRNMLLDKVKLEGTFRVESFDLYEDDAQAKIDFTDASAPITAKAYYSVGSPEDVATQNQRALTKQVSLWTYRYEDPRDRVATLLDGALRPRLQTQSIEEAQHNSDRLCEEAVNDVRGEMAATGAYPSLKKALILEDIDLPAQVIALREQRLRGEADAQEMELELQGPLRAIQAVQKGWKPAEGQPALTFQEARDLVMESRRLDVLLQSKANITLVASNLEGVVQTLEVNKRNPET